MLDQGAHGGIADERRAQSAEAELPVHATLHQLERHGGLEQQLGGAAGQLQRGGDVSGALRALREQLEELEAHAGIQDL